MSQCFACAGLPLPEPGEQITICLPCANRLLAPLHRCDRCGSQIQEPGLCDFCAADLDLERAPRSLHPSNAALASAVMVAMGATP